MKPRFEILKHPLPHGVFQIILSAYWLSLFADDIPHFYNYSLTDIFLRSRWVLATFLILGFAGAVIGLAVLLKRVGILHGYLSLVGMLTIAILLDYVHWNW